MKKFYIKTVTTFLFSCYVLSGCKNTSSNTCIGLDEFYELQSLKFNSLMNEFKFQYHSFDMESIDYPKNLTEIICSVLDSTKRIDYSIKSQIIDSAKNLYILNIKVQDSIYTFSNNINNQWFEPENNILELNRICSNHYPKYTFNTPHYPGDQSLIILFAKKTELVKAIEKGFPCDVFNKPPFLIKKKYWDNIFEIKCKITQLPNCEQLKSDFIIKIEELKNKGLEIPSLKNNDRLFIGKLFNENDINIIVNWSEHIYETGKIKNNTISFYGTGIWNTIFLLMISESYGNQSIQIEKKNSIDHKTSIEFEEMILDSW